VIRRVACIALVALGAIAAAPAARADFTPPTLVSGSPTVEADYGFSPVISANARYVVFAASLAGVPGIYRRDLDTGAIDMVAAGASGAPSVSSNGQFVSFTTTNTNPATGTGTQCSSVYVRDMSQPMTASGAFALASALSGTTAGLTYAGSGTSSCPGGGSSAAGRVALSGNGTEVAFTVVGASNLTTGVDGAPTTPGAQVAVRDLQTDTTILVSQTMASLGSSAPQPVAGGAALIDLSTGAGPRAGTANSDAGDSTAALSADGTTVAWQGINIPQQAPAAAQDNPIKHVNEYDEPLWRRIADGPTAPIRRVLGGDDPTACADCTGPLDLQWDDPDPLPGQEVGPERGGFIAWDGLAGPTDISRATIDDATPQLSANGQIVAVISTAPDMGENPCAAHSCADVLSGDAYVVNMAAGLGRDRAMTRLTKWASESFTNLPLAAPIEDIAISPEGNRVAFVTRRTVFPFSPPSLITPELSSATFEQLYVADLSDETLQLATLGYDGQPANGAVISPSFSANDGPIAFASSATNLVFGAFSDLPGGSEVFTTTEEKPPAIPGVQLVSPLPPNPTLTPDWLISASVAHGRGGTAVVAVTVPSAGRLSAVAKAAVPVTGGAARAARRSAHGKHRSRRRLVTRAIARGAAAAAGPGTVSLTLRPAAAYRSLLRRTRGLYTTITVTFAVVGRRPLTEKLPIDLTGGGGAKHSKRRRRHP
jgi:hypothetical protein